MYVTQRSRNNSLICVLIIELSKSGIIIQCLSEKAWKIDIIFCFRDADNETPFMLAINCRAYRAALILLDIINKVAARELTGLSLNESEIAFVPFLQMITTESPLIQKSSLDAGNS